MSVIDKLANIIASNKTYNVANRVFSIDGDDLDAPYGVASQLSVGDYYLTYCVQPAHYVTMKDGDNILVQVVEAKIIDSQGNIFLNLSEKKPAKVKSSLLEVTHML